MTEILTITAYSDKSFVVRGDTKTFKRQLIEKGGRWNPHLQGGGGYIFSNKALDEVTVLINQINTNKISVNLSGLPGASSSVVLPVKSNMQTVTWTLYRPSIGNTATIDIEGNKLVMTVVNIFENHTLGGGIDTIKLLYNSNDKIENQLQNEPMLFEAIICNGKWQIKGEIRTHDISF